MKTTLQQLFRVPHANELAMRELNEAKRELLKAQSGRDYAQAMCEYHMNRINRLEAMLQRVEKK